MGEKRRDMTAMGEKSRGMMTVGVENDKSESNEQ